uniref:Uncharacterized protein n=1 Tax=Magnetococcus massalia (strain MO-1) TaxID=451514 RepID=A0A1S7LD70_MAGMO|nr:Protein of unknown function [Candidatus Magnetococcus massalia]
MKGGRKVVPGQRWQGVVSNGAVSIVVLWEPVHLTPQRSQRAAWGRITVILHEISGLVSRCSHMLLSKRLQTLDWSRKIIIFSH